MKLAIFSILLVFGALQVDFVQSALADRIQDLNKLWYQANDLRIRLDEFKKKKIDLKSEKIFNETVSSLDQVTNLTLVTQEKIEDEADTLLTEDELIDIDSCLNVALISLRDIILSDCGAFGSCRDHTVTEINLILVEWTNYTKIVDEIKTQIVYVRDKVCSGYTGYAKELCLYCRTPQIKVVIISQSKKIERYEKRVIKLIDFLIHQVTACLSDSTDQAVDKIRQIEVVASSCFAQLCNATSTTTAPPTTVPPTTLPPTTVAVNQTTVLPTSTTKKAKFV